MLDPKPWSGARRKTPLYFLSSPLKSLESPSTRPPACPSANSSSEQDGWMGWILGLGGENDDTTMSHLSKFICKLSVILSSWIFLSLYPLSPHMRVTCMTFPTDWTAWALLILLTSQKLNEPPLEKGIKEKERDTEMKPGRRWKLGIFMQHQILINQKCTSPSLTSTNINPRSPRNHRLGLHSGGMSHPQDTRK